MRRYLVFLVIISASLLASFMTALSVERSRIVSAQTFPMEVNVIDDKTFIGINADPDGFYFGIIAQGNYGKRRLEIEADEDVFVTIKKTGNISGMIDNPNNFVVKAGEKYNASIYCTIPDDKPVGDYVGEMKVVLRKAK